MSSFIYAPAMTPPAGRFLSREECTALTQRAMRMAVGGGETGLHISSSWVGNLRWARNEITTGGDIRDTLVYVRRRIRGAQQFSATNQTDDAGLERAVRCAERLVINEPEQAEEAFFTSYVEPYPEPAHLWSDRTYALDADARAEAAHGLTEPARRAGMLSAGYIETHAIANGLMNWGGRSFYHPFTIASYSVTVRDPDGTGSGWAGADHTDWSAIDAAALSAIALDKCLRSRNPVALEPGRYTTILEPQAVSDFVSELVSRGLDRYAAENWPPRTPFSGTKREESKIGEQVIDPRLTIGVDPHDPAMAFVPIDLGGTVYHAVDWIKEGVLRELSYPRNQYGIRELGKNTGLPNNGAFYIRSASDGGTSLDDMIATTKRGIYVTRFSNLQLIDFTSMLMTGYTRDGTWLIENGKITKPVKNLRFTDSALFSLNSVEQIGEPKRVFRAGVYPVVVPALKIRDFSFTALSDAV